MVCFKCGTPLIDKDEVVYSADSNIVHAACLLGDIVPTFIFKDRIE